MRLYVVVVLIERSMYARPQSTGSGFPARASCPPPHVRMLTPPPRRHGYLLIGEAAGRDPGGFNSCLFFYILTVKGKLLVVITQGRCQGPDRKGAKRVKGDPSLLKSKNAQHF